MAVSNVPVLADGGASLRAWPYPFAHAVSFFSDVDGQSPAEGVRIHELLNVELGLPVSDSLWPHETQGVHSSLFTGLHEPNRRPSGVGTQTTQGLLLREWHRGNIDHFHAWHGDTVYPLRFEPRVPIRIEGASLEVTIPPAPPETLSADYTQLRLHFQGSLPAPVSLTLGDERGRSLHLPWAVVRQGSTSHSAEGAASFDVRVALDSVSSDELPVDLAALRTLRIDVPACRDGCEAALARVERDAFSRRTVLAQAPILAGWNVRPVIVTSHGGLSFAQNFSSAGMLWDLGAAGGPHADSQVASRVASLGAVPGSHAFHLDLLRRLGVLAVWLSDAPDVSDVLRAHTAPIGALPRFAERTYSFPRTRPAMDAGKPVDRSNAESFARSMKQALDTSLTNEELAEFYCGPSCLYSDGRMLGLLVALSLERVQRGHEVEHLWYTHFGSAGAEPAGSARGPIPASAMTQLMRLRDHYHGFDQRITPSRRVWVVPVGSFVRYKLVRHQIGEHLSVDAGLSTVRVSRWVDEWSGATVPEAVAGTRDLHGITVYMTSSAEARLFVDGKESWSFTRNPPDATGRSSISVVDDNTPTIIFDEIPLRYLGAVDVRAGNLRDAAVDLGDAATGRRYLSLIANRDGVAEVDLSPSGLDLWNITHLRLAIRRHGSMSKAASGRLTVELTMEDGGIVRLVHGATSAESSSRAGSEPWSSAALRPAVVDGGWERHVVPVAMLRPGIPSVREREGRGRPPLPLGGLSRVRLIFEGGAAGERIDVDDLAALRPSGNGESASGGKLVAGRVTRDGANPAAGIWVEWVSTEGSRGRTVTDADGYYYFPGVPRGLAVQMSARIGLRTCAARGGALIDVRKNEAELDIDGSRCVGPLRP